jgi:D-xylose 1-dehydrogenase (NADP+, D-xylono-1,5-lactone-forming)
MGGQPILTIRRGTTLGIPVETVEVAGGNGFLAEAESFRRLILEGSSGWTGATPEESVDIALTLDAIAKSARTGATVDIADRPA